MCHSNKSVTLLSAFRSANEVLQGAVQGIADLIKRGGLVNVDFADVRTVMSEMGMAVMGTGNASGDDRAREAAEAAISSPLLEDVDLSGAKGVLVNITAGSDMSIGEFEIVGDSIRACTSEDATVVVGTVIDLDMKDEIRVTVVVTGLDRAKQATHHGLVDKMSQSEAHSTPTFQVSAKEPEKAPNYLDIPAFLRKQDEHVD